MKKETLVQCIIIAILIVILSFLCYQTISVINDNKGMNNNNMEMNVDKPNGENFSSSSAETSGVTEITEDTTIASGKYTSTNVDEVAILVDGDIEVSLSDIEITKTGDSDGGDNTSFYGINSAILAKNGANLILKNINVTTDRNRSKWSI